MESAVKIIIVLVVISAALAFVPSLIGGSAFSFGASSETLSQAVNSRGGIITVSYDGGETFKDAKVFTTASPQIINIDTRGGLDSAPFSPSKLFYAGTDQGLLISHDGGLSWYPFTDLEKKLDFKTIIYAFAFEPGSNTIFVSAFKNGHGVIYKTDDNFFSVTPVWEEKDMPVPALAIDNNILHMGLNDGRLLSYHLDNQNLKKTRDFGSAIQGINLTNNGQNLFVLLSNGNMWASTDYGTAWEQSNNNNGLAFFSSSGKNLSLKTDKDNPAVLYLASASGIFRSINQGSSWNALNTILPGRADVSALAAENGKIYVSAGTKLYESKDGGETWKVKEPLVTSRKLGSLYVANDGQLVVVGTKE